MSQRKGNKTNEFARCQQFVGEALNDYREIRNKLNLPNKWGYSRTIEHIARPFIDGYFTIAVVGKVSAGKSTFINALLGCRDLLPTGHDQTTCGITYIEYGDKPEVSITFGDGHEETIKDDINGKIKPLVAIPDEFHNLPVNNIDEMILGGWGFKQIWELHEQLEEKTLCCKIDKSLLKKYISARQKKDIATEVRIKYPFDQELRGWKIIDTPGIGAIGGIEMRTRQLLATQKKDGSREVDAIIFLQNGSQTLDQSDSKKFVKETLDNFTEVDRNRLFYVLTHASASDFRNHIEEKLNFIKANYGDKIKKLNYTDSLLYAFMAYVKKEKLNLKDYEGFDKPGSWSDDEWDKVCEMLDNAKRGIRKSGDTFNHETMLRMLSDWAHFDSLKKEINEFAKNEKREALKKLIDLTRKDYERLSAQLPKEIALLDGGVEKIKHEKKTVEERRKKYNEAFRSADNEIRKDTMKKEFNFINDELQKVSDMYNEAQVRSAITNIFDRTQKREKEVFGKLQQVYSDLLTEYVPEDITFESIDFDAIEAAAEIYAEEEYEISPARVEKQRSKPDKYVQAEYGTWINPEEKLRQFKALAIKRLREGRDKFLRQVSDKVNNMKQAIEKEVDAKLKYERQCLDELEKKLSDKENEKARLNASIELVRKTIHEYESTLKEYGYDK